MRVLDAKKTVLIFLCAVVLIVTLFFGLRPRGFSFRNQADLLDDGSGMAFSDVGMAYSRGTLGDVGISDSLSLALTIKPYRTGRQLSKIVSLVDAKGRALLEIEQWMAGLLVTVWDEGGNRLGDGKIG